MNLESKSLFIDKMKLLLNNNEDMNLFLEHAKTLPKKSIRINTLKISTDIFLEKFINKNWEIKQFQNNPEIIQVISSLLPGELGKTKEHILGYYYIQEITSMMPILALDLKPKETFLDLCASPGSKTTQAAAKMENSGIIIANDISISRITILSANLERCGVTNTIITRHPGQELCIKLKKLNYKFDKILVDAPCSGEGNLRYSKNFFQNYSERLIKKLASRQKSLASHAYELLKENGIMVYSTCTYSPEENEEVIQYLLDKYNDIKIEKINLPIKTRQGLSVWNNTMFNSSIKNCCRIYHQDNDLEGFFICKIKKNKNITLT